MSRTRTARRSPRTRRASLDRIKGDPEFEGSVHGIKQFRRHDRAIIKAQRERTYKLDGMAVAKNRKPRFEQSGPSLSDLMLSGTELARLEAIPSRRYYNDKDRLIPGTAFRYEGERYVVSVQLSNGAYLRAIGEGNRNFPAGEYLVIHKNEGLVLV